jgi:hypothetical protein
VEPVEPTPADGGGTDAGGGDAPPVNGDASDSAAGSQDAEMDEGKKRQYFQSFINLHNMIFLQLTIMRSMLLYYRQI